MPKNTLTKPALEPWGDFKPTLFDRAGLNSSPGWFVVPVGRNRDSGPLHNSNFETARDMIRLEYRDDDCGVEFNGDGPEEGDEFGVCSYGHWACGWFELLVVKGGTRAEAAALEIAGKLANYPILDDDDYYTRRWDLAFDYWESLDQEERAEMLLDEGCPPLLAEIAAREGYNGIESAPMFGLHWFGEFSLHPHITADGEDKRKAWRAWERVEEKLESDLD